jgi:dTDP-4-dehydrorhamnose reductase
VTRPGKRIVVIGRHGQVSRSLWEALNAAGHDVVQIARPGADLSNPAAVRAAILAARPEIVINSAAYTAVDKAEDEPAIAEAINVAGAEAVALAAAKANAPVIHFSTDYVFDGHKASPYVETDATGPLGVYGRTKLEGERRITLANPRHVIVRTAWVCSPYGSNFVKTMLRLAGERSELRVVDDQFGSPTFAADLAEVVCHLIPQIMEGAGPTRFGIFHAANSGETTWRRFAEAIMDGAARRGAPYVPVHPITTQDYPTKARRPAHSVLSTEKLAAVYGIRLRPWQAALAACLDQLIRPIGKEALEESQNDGEKRAP